jgi:hypothetical protein
MQPVLAYVLTAAPLIFKQALQELASWHTQKL